MTAAQASPFSDGHPMETVAKCCLCQSRDILNIDNDCHLCRCSACGYIFDSPRPNEQQIVAFYSEAEKYDSWLLDPAARDALWERRLNMLLPHRRPGNLLDIGTGIGQFLYHARKYFTDVAGTEISATAVRVARERYGLKVLAGQVEDLPLPDSSFDNITLFHVLEHVPNPAKLARICCRLLRPGGILCVAVPNDVLAWGSLVKRTGKRMGVQPFQKFSGALGVAKAGSSREIHLSHFTPAVLRRLMRSAGFEIVKEGLDPYYASAGFWKLAHSMYYRLHCVLFSFTGLNRYETIWMIARKPGSAS
ncbi:MAG TPA: methyltransferase domain-containing protein [Candidatus Angelobacter sp.]|nr:methyltransferase domain-containing protein [Candidatus Angelobacter sp.]